MEDLYINVPIAPLFIAPSFNATLIDEVLYGTKVTVLFKKDKWACIKTDYGYTGYTPFYTLETPKIDLSGTMESIVSAQSSSILEYPNVKSNTIATVFCGSRLFMIDTVVYKNYVPIVILNGNLGFIHKNNIRKKDDILKLDEDKLRSYIVEQAFLYLGATYKYGGKTHLGIDCSGLCSQAYLNAGISIYRDSIIHKDFPVKEKNLTELKKADLIYFKDRHMAMYVGDGIYIHSNATDGRVALASLNSYDSLYRKDLSEKIDCFGGIDFI